MTFKELSKKALQMINVRSEFLARVEEIELYFNFMENVMKEGAGLAYPDGTTEIISPELNNIFMANSFLLLYNLSEACIKDAINEIHLSINNEGVSYDKLKVGIRKELIQFLKSHVNVDDFVSSINQVAYEMILKCFNSDKLLSGNLDARKVKGLATKYGFSCSINPMKNSEGMLTNIETRNLYTVKKNRNELAHGIYSFKECGQNYAIQDVVTIKNHVIEYLRQILDHIDDYITNKGYLASCQA